MSDPFIEASTTGWIAKHREQYQADSGAGHMWDSSFAGGPGLLPTLLLTTIGRKSGNESIMPLLYGEVDGGYAIIASKGGHDSHPGWYHNLMAQDDVTVQVESDVFSATTRVAAGDERSKIWAQMVAMYPPFGDYQEKAGSREIPVVVLERK
ncbi:MAG: nitroreductase family deazaflavin-dependent oxidoreductase [Pseudomonadota bacterium]